MDFNMARRPLFVWIAVDKKDVGTAPSSGIAGPRLPASLVETALSDLPKLRDSGTNDNWTLVQLRSC
jgi:hypothetical protein